MRSMVIFITFFQREKCKAVDILIGLLLYRDKNWVKWAFFIFIGDTFHIWGKRKLLWEKIDWLNYKIYSK